MPCHVDTIVKINQIRQTYKDETKLTIYATGTYPIESEDHELEMVLFIPINDEDRDPNTQSIFEKNEFYCVGGKIVFANFNGSLKLKMTVACSTHLTIKRDLSSNRCPLKASLIGIMQDVPTEIDDENAIINVLVEDYAGQNYSFAIKIIFPYHNTRFKHLMNSTRSTESMLFIVGQMEVIEKDLYIYAVDISYININYGIKRKTCETGNSQTTTKLYRSVRSKLLTAHQNVNENTSRISETTNAISNKEKSESVIENSNSTRHTRVEDDYDEDNDLYE
ncbi:10666_t:CDS:2 [Dentiscutata erythropus]|uniref:10666_t:CDS:1 n=1 Tax=Dentiscutata erythropus TaxID=1348616 RepID=A0A9N9JPL0_9GLOM|nr:10666_t:CDS:2 [Dentiscutata erythropus]